MRKIDKVGAVFNIILSIIYVPMSFVGMLGIMMSDGIIGTTDKSNFLFITKQSYIINSLWWGVSHHTISLDLYEDP